MASRSNIAARTARSPALRRGCIDFDDAGQQRLAGGQPVHRRRGPAQPPAGRRRVRQRPAARRDRAEECRRRERDDLDAPSASFRPTRRRFPSLFTYNAVLVVSDGVQARIGTLSADKEWFKPWRTIDGRERCAAKRRRSCRCCSRACSSKRRFLDLLRHFIVFEDDGGGDAHKKMAGYHQFHAVNVAVEETLRAAPATGAWPRSRRAATRRAAAGRRAGRPARRRGLAHAGLRQEPDDGLLRRPRDPAPGDGEPDARGAHRPQRSRRPALRHVRALPRPAAPDAGAGRRPRRPAREAARSPSGGVVFTTIQKFFPEEKGDRHPVLSDRRNIVVIADEAHRSQYDFIDGFARAHARRAAERLVHRLHRHADREDRRQHARGLRRLHQHLRHPARRRRRRHGADLLREPAREAGAEGRRAAEDRRGVRGGHRRRRGRRARRSSRAKWAQLEALVGIREADRARRRATW